MVALITLSFMDEKLQVIKTLRISEELNASVINAATKLETAEQDVIRLALRIGLMHLDMAGFDIAKSVIEAARKSELSKTQAAELGAKFMQAAEHTRKVFDPPFRNRTIGCSKKREK